MDLETLIDTEECKVYKNNDLDFVIEERNFNSEENKKLFIYTNKHTGKINCEIDKNIFYFRVVNGQEYKNPKGMYKIIQYLNNRYNYKLF